MNRNTTLSIKKIQRIFAVLCLSVIQGLTFGQINETDLILASPFSGNANDETSLGNHAIVSGATLTADRYGTANSAYYFDGIDDEISYPVTTDHHISLPISISIWMKTEIVSPTEFVRFFCTHDNGTYGGVALFSRDGKLEVAYGDGGGSGSSNKRRIAFQDVINEKEWHHIAVVIKGPTDFDVYIDNVLQTTGSYAGSGGDIAYPSGGYGKVGTVDWGNNLTDEEKHFNGTVDDIYVWNRAITPQEIDDIFDDYDQVVASTNPITSSTPSVHVYPTISEKTFTIDVEEASVIGIYDLQNRLIQQFEVAESIKFGSELVQGMYILNIKNSKGTFSHNIVKN